MIISPGSRLSARGSGRRPLGTIDRAPGYYAGYRQTFTVDGSQNVTEWTEESGNGLDLTPASVNVPSRRYWFGGHRGVETTEELDLATPKTFSPPWEVWCAIECEGLAANQRLIQSADSLTDIFQITTAGAVRCRINNSNFDVTPTGTIVAGTKYVVGIYCDASGDIKCEVNGTEHVEAIPLATDTWDFDHVGHDSASASSRVGALYFFESTLTESERRLVRQDLNDFTVGTIAAIGISNTWDAIQGYNTAGGVHMFHSAAGFNSQPLENWFDNIGVTGSPPWLTFINELSPTGSSGHPYSDRIWFYVGISPTMMDPDPGEAAMQTMMTDVLAEARTQMTNQGNDGANAPLYVSYMAFYPDPTVNCSIVSSGAWQRSVDLHDWAVAGGLTDAIAGPVLPDITMTRADDGDPTSPCHVEENWKPDDGWVLRNFFG